MIQPITPKIIQRILDALNEDTDEFLDEDALTDWRPQQDQEGPDKGRLE